MVYSRDFCAELVDLGGLGMSCDLGLALWTRPWSGRLGRRGGASSAGRQNLVRGFCVWECEGGCCRGRAVRVSRQAELEEFTGFVVGSQAKMVRLAELVTGDRDRAEDLAQDGFAKAFAAWRRIRDQDPAAYVRRCIINANIDWWRRRSWRERPHADLPDRPGGPDVAAVLAARDLVLRALARLTARERAVLALRFYFDLSEAQISAELRIAPGTVKSTLARALAKLRADADLRSGAAS
jgi:RNA polymerase sigma-70 factor (sigma-E family)